MESPSSHPPGREPLTGSSFWLTRFLILRLLGFVYFFAFLSAATQVLPLMGSDGLTPVSAWLDQVAGRLGSGFAGLLRFPSLFWLGAPDAALPGLAWLGAGLIKLRGDPCWRDLTCLDYHYLTQPIPNPLSRWFHFHPPVVHKLEVLYNHFVELVACWFALAPDRLRRVRLGGGVAMLAFQVSLILSGNLSFLNHLTIVPILA